MIIKNNTDTQIVAEAYGEGNFNLERKNYEKDIQTITTMVYEGTSIQNGSKAMITNSKGIFSQMSVDVNGDGTIDKNISYTEFEETFQSKTNENNQLGFEIFLLVLALSFILLLHRRKYKK